MVGLQECQPLAVENDSTSSLLSLGPKSAPKFPGVCYDGAAGDGVLCRFQKIIPVWCFFFLDFGRIQSSIFFIHCPRDTTRWHKHYANMMGEKERLTRNLMQFVCIFFVSLWGIHSSDFPGFYDGFIPIHPVHQDIAAVWQARHLGLVEKHRTNGANFVELVGRCGRGRTKSKSLFLYSRFLRGTWTSMKLIELFWRDGRLFLKGSNELDLA